LYIRFVCVRNTSLSGRGIAAPPAPPPDIVVEEVAPLTLMEDVEAIEVEAFIWYWFEYFWYIDG
jgi:hypothetical protein